MSVKEQRTIQQNKSIHKYCDRVAEELRNQGQTMHDVINHITKAEIVPTKDNVKIIIWHEIQKAMFGKKSTAELTTGEVDKVYQVMAKFLAREFDITLPFPSEEERLFENE